MRRTPFALAALLVAFPLSAQTDAPPERHSGPVPVALVDANSTTGAQPLACPSGSSFDLSILDDCPTGSTQLVWTVPSGAVNGSTVYEIYRTDLYPDYCSAPPAEQRNVVRIASTTGTPTMDGRRSFTYTVSTANRAYAHYVKVQGCEIYNSGALFRWGDTFTSSATPPVITGSLTAANQITITYRVPEGKSFSFRRIERSKDGGAFSAIAGLDVFFQNYCPANSQKSISDSGLAPGTYTYRAFADGDRADCYDDVVSAQISVTVPAACSTPGTPQLSGPSTVAGGKSFTASWTAAPNLASGGRYFIETSFDAFKSIASTSKTTSLSAIIPTSLFSTDATLSVRVRAVQSCGSVGGNSNVINIRLTAAPANFVVVRAGPSWTAAKGGTPPSDTVVFRNVGGQSGQLNLRALGGFFSFGPSTLIVRPGDEGTVTLTAAVSALGKAGVYQGSLVGGFDNFEVFTPVTLTVTDSGPSSARARAADSSVIFKAPAGQSPTDKSIVINVSNLPRSGSVYLSPKIGPGGAWLELGSELGNPVPGTGQLSLTLHVNRAKRARGEGATLFRTVLRLTPAGGDPDSDSAVIEILDVETLTTTAASGLRGSAGGSPDPLAVSTPPGGSSFILSTAVKAVSGISGAVFTSDAWLRNLSDQTVTAEIFCTANGVNGLNSASGLIKTNVNIPGNGTFRMSDLMTTVFSVPSGVSASIEVRSPQINSLTLRSSTDSILNSDPSTRFGTEIPVVSFRSGVGVGDGELMLAGIDKDTQNRANLIFGETAGGDAHVKVTVNTSDGRQVGSTEVDVLPLSKQQVDDIVGRAGVSSLSGGWLGVTVTSGTGKVVPIATVIDNASGSFSAVLGQQPPPSISGARTPLAGSRSYMVPTVARTIGVNNTLFFTSMSLVNGTGQPAALTATYHYVDQDAGGVEKTAVKGITIAARGSMPKLQGNDVVRDFFGVTNRSFGYVVIEGAVDRVTGVAKVSAQIDPNNPAAGFNSSQVNGIFLDSPSVMALDDVERRFAGIEKSFQRRTNLIMIEVDGQPSKVRVRLNSTAGELMAEGTFDVGAGQYRQLNDVFGTLGLGDGPFQNVEVTTQVVEGGGRVLAAASVIDNISRSPQIFILTQPAPPADPSIGF